MTASGLQSWIARLATLGLLLTPLGLLPFVQRLYEETYLTRTRGPQSLFFSVAHGVGFDWLGPFAVLGYFGFLVAPFFLVWLLVYACFLLIARRRSLPIPWWNHVLLVVAAVPPALALVPYDFWLALLT